MTDGPVAQPDHTPDDPSYTFVLDGADGEQHTYRVSKKHTPMSRGQGPSGLKLINYVATVAAEPIARLLESNAGSLMETYTQKARTGEGMGQEDILDSVDSDDLNDVNMDFASAVNALVDAYDSIDPEDVFQKLFYFTTRDGQQLAKAQNFNQAYAGNYVEAFKAAYKVCQFNGFFGSLGGRIETTTGDNE